MKNKLLTTALVSSMLGLGVTSAVAQTTISGNLEITYNAVTNSAAPGLSYRGFGKESQINVQNKGKLSNGLDYAAGFSIELDGPDLNVGTTGSTGVSTGTGVHFENNYIDLISGNTTFTISADHIQNPDSNPTMLAGFGYLGVDGIGATTGYTALYPKAANSPYSSFGFGLMQKVPGVGTFSALYVPTNATNQGALNDISNSATAAAAEPTTLSGNSSESAIEIGFVGDFGVNGLTVQAFMNQEDAPDGQSVNKKGKVIAATYVTGPFSIAADWRQAQGVQTGAAVTTMNGATETVKGKSVGLGYALSKDLTASITRGKADTNRTSSVTETTDVVAIGYNLGAVTTGLQYKKVDDGVGTANNDAKTLQFRIGTKF